MKLFGLNLPFFSFSSGGTAVGLNIGSSSVKLAELKKKGDAWKLVRYGQVNLPEDAIVAREIVNPASVTHAIKTLIKEISPSNKSVCSSLSGTSVIVKPMEVECGNESELEGQIFWEAEQYLPFDIADVIMDFHKIKETQDGKYKVILVAVKKSVLDAYMGCIEDAQIRPSIIDLDYFALQHVYETNYAQSANEAVALVDIGANATRISIVCNGVPVLNKDSGVGGNSLTSAIQKTLNISFGDAESLKIGAKDGSIPQEVSDLLNLSSENVAIEIKRAIDFYTASSNEAPVTGVILAGGGSKVPQMQRVIEEKVSLPTQYVNPFNAVIPESFSPEYVEEISAVAAIPIGLALRAGAEQ